MVTHKTRVSGSEVKVNGIAGEVRGRMPVLVDDMISTAGTIEAAARALLAAGCRREITVVASHALLVGPAVERLSALPLKRLYESEFEVLSGVHSPIARSFGSLPPKPDSPPSPHRFLTPGNLAKTSLLRRETRLLVG